MIRPRIVAAAAMMGSAGSRQPSVGHQSRQIDGDAAKGKCAAEKAVQRLLPAPRPHWVGDGFHVYPVFADHAFSEALSPFLMFDYGAPRRFEPTSRRLGVGQHPHRGFETVTIAFQGEVEHADSVGNRDVIGPGDVQWMTAGRGIIHEEFHSTKFARSGGLFEMCQLWVNLPKKDKMTAPRYQPIVKGDIPVVPLPGAPEGVGQVRIIAGSCSDSRGPAQTFSPVELWDVEIRTEGGTGLLEIPEGHNTIIFVRRGALRVGDRAETVGPQGVAMMHKAGHQVRVQAAAPDTALLVLAGQPLNEPIAARGPFVMNTQKELGEAFEDYRRGTLGR